MKSRSCLLIAAGLLISFGIAGCANSQADSGLPPEFEICEPPCWSNISPGISTEEDVQRILGEQSPDAQCEETYNYGVSRLNCGRFDVVLQQRGGLVDIVYVRPNTSVTLGEIVQRYGEPDVVEFRIGGGIPEAPSNSPFIHYPKRGMTLYFGDRRGDDYTITQDMVVVTFSYRQPYALGLWGDSWTWLTYWHGFADYEQYGAR